MSDLDKDLEALRAAYEADPDNVDAASALAQNYADRGWHNQAIDLYRRLAKEHPENYAVLLDYGNVCFRRGDHSEALITFSRLTDLKPERVEGWNNLGIAYLKTGNHEAARDALDRVLAIEPDNAGALLNMGNYHQAKGDGVKAEELLRRAVAVRPDFPDAWFNLGNVLLARKELGQAVECFSKALKYQPEFASAHKNLGVAYEELRDFDAALEHYQKALQLNRADAGLYLNTANVLVKQGAYDRAKHHYLRCVKLAPRDMAGWMGLRHLALLRGDVDAYAKATLAILQRLDADAIAESVRILRGLQQWERVDDLIDTADRLEKQSDELDAERLLAYHRKSAAAARVAELSRRLGALPAPSATVRTCLAAYHLASGRFDEAVGALDKIDCSEPERQILLWRALIGRGDLQRADDLARPYLEAHPDCADAWCYAALVKVRLGREEEARNLLLRALGCGAVDPSVIESDPALKKLHASIA